MEDDTYLIKRRDELQVVWLETTHEPIPPALELTVGYLKTMYLDLQYTKRNLNLIRAIVKRSEKVVKSLNDSLSSRVSPGDQSRDTEDVEAATSTSSDSDDDELSITFYDHLVHLSNLERMLAKASTVVRAESQYAVPESDNIRTWSGNLLSLYDILERLHNPQYEPQDPEWSDVLPVAIRKDISAWATDLSTACHIQNVAAAGSSGDTDRSSLDETQTLCLELGHDIAGVLWQQLSEGPLSNHTYLGVYCEVLMYFVWIVGLHLSAPEKARQEEWKCLRDSLSLLRKEGNVPPTDLSHLRNTVKVSDAFLRIIRVQMGPAVAHQEIGPSLAAPFGIGWKPAEIGFSGPYRAAGSKMGQIPDVRTEPNTVDRPLWSVMPHIRHIHSEADMTTQLNQNSIVVVDFHAPWSGPCRAITPFYSQLAAKHRTVTFVKFEVDLDNIQSVAQNYRLTEIPTFITLKNGGEIDRVRGPDRKGLEDMIGKHAPEDKPFASGASSADYSDSSLLEYLVIPQVNCLNEAQDHTLRSIVATRARNITEDYLESDVDEQLLITLPFNHVVKVRSIVLHTKNPKFGPKNIKISINNPALDFGDVESATEPAVVQALEVQEDFVREGKPIHLRFVRLQQVNSLHIFVASNHGNEDVTRIDAIDVYGPSEGQPEATTLMGGLRNFLDTHDRGMNLLHLFQSQGGIQNLSNSALLLREALLLCPTGDQYRAKILGNLLIVLFTQYEQHGDSSDLMEVIALGYQVLGSHPPGHPNRALSLNILSNALMARHEREGSLIDLSEATEYYQEALQLSPLGHPSRAESLNNLANALLTRYKREGSLMDLSEATEHCREALELRPPGHPKRASSLNNLSNALLTRYEHEGSLADLSEATELHREALELHPPGHPDRAKSLNGLSNALMARYEREGSIQDLSEATEQYREALGLRFPGHPDRASSLNNISNALLTRYEREGSPADLSEAIEGYREALELHPPGHPDRAKSLNGLSNAFMARYECEGSLMDLSEAAEYYQEALGLCPPGHPNRASSLSNLSNVLLSRYGREGSLTDLSEATERCREALELHPPGHPDRAKSLNGLSNALMARYEREGSLVDLSEATEYYQEALQLHPLDHPGRAESLKNLSNALRVRYEREGNLTDLSNATEYCREALQLCPPGHPNRAQFLYYLSRVLLQTIDLTGDADKMQGYQTLVLEVFGALREAVGLSSCPPRHRLRAALQWIDAARKLDAESALDAYRAALDQLDVVLAASNTLETKYTELSSSKELVRCRRLGVEAASYAIRQGHAVLAVELLERGRNLLLAQVGRYRVDFEDLQKVNAYLADRFSDLSRLLDATVVSNEPSLEGRTVFEDPIERYQRVTSDWSRVVDDIRAIAGFEHFLQYPDYAALRSAAVEGPVIVVIPGSNQSDALIISDERDVPHHVNLPNAKMEDLVELANSLNKTIHPKEDRLYDEVALEKPLKKVLRSLWDLVVEPIADALEHELHVPLHTRIWWCPTSILSALPLHAAGRYRAEATKQTIPARYVSSYTPTLQALPRARSKRSAIKAEKTLIVAQLGKPQSPDWLPNAQSEAELVKKLLEENLKTDTTLLLGEEGTRVAVLQGMVDHSWLHLICRSSQDFANPLRSGFGLYDAPLTLLDIMQRGLPDATFAFLAACLTTTGDRELLDEGLNLAAGFHFAGFKSVVGTCWESADIDGPVIAEAFYKALQDEGMDYSKAAYALSRAVERLRDIGVPLHRRMCFVHIGI